MGKISLRDFVKKSLPILLLFTFHLEFIPIKSGLYTGFIYSQEIDPVDKNLYGVDIKTKIKEWFDIPFGPSSGRGLTIPTVRYFHRPEQSRGSEGEGLKHKDPTVRDQVIVILRKR